MSMSNNKCQAKGGPAACTNPNCPEKHLQSNLVIPKSFAVQAQRKQPTVPFGAWTDENTVLFRTQTGSKLYGLGNANSDDDYYVVTPSKQVTYRSKRIKASQSFEGDKDTVYMDFKSFVALCEKGVPNTLEVMFSRASVSEFFEDYRNNYFCSDPVVIHKYMATIKMYSLGTGDSQFKYRRHALRLAHNLEEILYTGRFNPTLTPAVARRITEMASQSDMKYFKDLEKFSPIEVDWEETFVKENGAN